MADPAVVNYVRKSMKAGITTEEITTFLLAEGWTRREINDALTIVNNENSSKNFTTHAMKQDIFNTAFEQRPFIGTIMSLVAGLLVINSLFSETGSFIMEIQNSIQYYFVLIGIVDNVLAALNLFLGFLIILGGFLIYKGYGGRGGLIVLLASIVLFIINGFVFGVLIGILGGIFGLSKR